MRWASHSPFSKRVVTRQLVKYAIELLVGEYRWDIARSARVMESTDQTRALVHSTGASIAVVDDLLQSRHIPAGNLVRLARLIEDGVEVLTKSAWRL